MASRKPKVLLNFFETRSTGKEHSVVSKEALDRIANIESLYAHVEVSNALGRFLQRLGFVKLEVTIFMKGRKYIHGDTQNTRQRIYSKQEDCNKKFRTVYIEDRG